MKFCTNCGFKMNDDIKFCPKCGTPQTMNSRTNNGSNTQNDGRFEGGSEFDRGNSENMGQPSWNNTNNQYQTNYNNQRQVNQGNFNNGQYQPNYGNNNPQYQNNYSNQNHQQTYANGFTIGQPQHLDFSQSLSYIWANKFDFDPTVQDNQKSIFWWSQLLIVVLAMAMMIVIGIPVVALGSSFGALILYVLLIALCLMEVPPIMRRLNYLGQNKNLAWLYFVPIAQFYILYLMFIDRGQINHG